MNQIEVEKQIEREQGLGIEPLYKGEPPFMKFTNGFGYQGVILIDRRLDLVQCHLCGVWMENINNTHLRMHRISVRDYKEQIGVFNYVGLSNQRLSELKVKYGIAHGDRIRERMAADPVFRKKVLSNLKIARSALVRSSRDRRKTFARMQRKNKLGLCDEQLQYRLDKFVQEHGRPPKSSEFNAKDYMQARFGTWNRALKHFGYKPTKEYVSRYSLRGRWRRALIFLGMRSRYATTPSRI